MFSKICSGCGKVQTYSTKGNLKLAAEANRWCSSCKKMGVKRKPFSINHRRNLSLRRGGDGLLNKPRYQYRQYQGAWSKAVRDRDGCCQHCGIKKNLHAHHKMQWDLYPSLRFELWNGITLCGSCHNREHHRIAVEVRKMKEKIREARGKYA